MVIRLLTERSSQAIGETVDRFMKILLEVEPRVKTIYSRCKTDEAC